MKVVTAITKAHCSIGIYPEGDLLRDLGRQAGS